VAERLEGLMKTWTFTVTIERTIIVDGPHAFGARQQALALAGERFGEGVVDAVVASVEELPAAKPPDPPKAGQRPRRRG
jgi:hypothetical protein